jgi:hypothetical protein
MVFFKMTTFEVEIIQFSLNLIGINQIRAKEQIINLHWYMIVIILY